MGTLKFDLGINLLFWHVLSKSLQNKKTSTETAYWGMVKEILSQFVVFNLNELVIIYYVHTQAFANK